MSSCFCSNNSSSTELLKTAELLASLKLRALWGRTYQVGFSTAYRKKVGVPLCPAAGVAPRFPVQGLALPCTHGATAQLCHVPDDGWGGNGRDGNGGAGCCWR